MENRFLFFLENRAPPSFGALPLEKILSLLLMEFVYSGSSFSALFLEYLPSSFSISFSKKVFRLVGGSAYLLSSHLIFLKSPKYYCLKATGSEILNSFSFIILRM